MFFLFSSCIHTFIHGYVNIVLTDRHIDLYYYSCPGFYILCIQLTFNLQDIHYVLSNSVLPYCFYHPTVMSNILPISCNMISKSVLVDMNEAQNPECPTSVAMLI